MDNAIYVVRVFFHRDWSRVGQLTIPDAGGKDRLLVFTSRAAADEQYSQELAHQEEGTTVSLRKHGQGDDVLGSDSVGENTVASSLWIKGHPVRRR